MIGFLLMGAITLFVIYLIFFKVYPSLAFRYTSLGERKARAEYGRIKREHPDAPEARVTEAEFVEHFVRTGPSPWKYVLAVFGLVLVGLPVSCVVGAASFMH